MKDLYNDQTVGLNRNLTKDEIMMSDIETQDSN